MEMFCYKIDVAQLMATVSPTRRPFRIVITDNLTPAIFNLCVEIINLCPSVSIRPISDSI